MQTTLFEKFENLGNEGEKINKHINLRHSEFVSTEKIQSIGKYNQRRSPKATSKMDAMY